MVKQNKDEIKEIEIKDTGYGTTPAQFSELKMFRVDNVLARKVMSWSAEEAKIAAMAIAAMQPDGSGLNKFNRVIFKTNDLIKMMGLTTANGQRKKELKDTINVLMKNSWVEYTEKDLELSAPGRTYESGFIFPYSKEEMGWTYIEIGNAFKDKFINLSSYFTNIELLAVMNFSSKAVITLYQTFCSWVNTNATVTISEKQLKEIYEIDENAYRRADGSFARAMFEQRTIKKAIVEINNCEYSSIHVNPKVDRNAVFSEEGQILAIKSYTFHISKKEKAIKKMLESRIDIVDVEQEKTLCDQIREQRDVLAKTRKISENIKNRLLSLTDDDFKNIENNIINNGNVPTVADKYFQKCILNYLTKPQQFSKRVAKLPEYYNELKKPNEQKVASPEEIAEVEEMLKNFGKE